MRPVTLLEVLEARERRAERQVQLLAQYKRPLICFTMNIAGPIKNTDEIAWGFRYGSRLLQRQLERSNARLLYQENRNEITGIEAYYVVDSETALLKALTVELEDRLPIGRLFDFDVLDLDGKKLERENERCCLICGKPGKSCARSRAHTVRELQEKTSSILRQAYDEWKTEWIGSLACRALLYEACTTPKPGLVDCRNSGSHKDMNLFSFLSSASVLQPYFQECVGIGIRTAHLPATCTFDELRWPGKLAEIKMLDCTAGTNTHKGAIFTMGVLCGALGRMKPYAEVTASMLLDECASMTRGVTEAELNRSITPRTAGEKLFQEYHVSGIRGQVEAGLPLVREWGLPVLERELQTGKTLNEAGCIALLAIMSNLEDTNLMKRGGPEALNWVSDQARSFLEKNQTSATELEMLDDALIERNLSPGGSADLLAVCYFLHFISEEFSSRN